MRVKGREGMTLIELMLVVAIVGILAAVAIPKYGELLEKANLGATLGNLAGLRSAVSIYYSDNMELPGTIEVGVQPGFSFSGGDTPSVKARYTEGGVSPYGNQIEVGVAAGAIPTAMKAGWFYNKAEGYVYINSISRDIKGKPYTLY